LTRGSLLSSLFGFNIGIEITQLLVVALVMPSLLVLARTAWYTPFRVAVSAAGLVFATSWALERAALTGRDPFVGVTEWLVGHPFVVAAALAVAALLARGASRPAPEPAAAAAI
jgi:hypothetical protein